MCGITGIIGSIEPSDIGTVCEMTRLLHHRGPDAGRVADFTGAVLGFRRLSIIDLSDRAMQPMVSADGRHVLICNGEIYNYRELRRELEGGYQFRSDSDIEVLLAAWRRWGEGCLKRLNGMFAFCVYDTTTRSAFFARDRIGQKPLYLRESNGRLAFSSEVKPILATGVDARPDMKTWSRYLVTACYDDTATTFFAGIDTLKPGECASYDSKRGLQRRMYYDIGDHLGSVTDDFETAAATLREHLIEACRIHMRADVPVGVMLSGGLDSSTLLASFDQSGQLSERVKCFSVEFGADLSERDWIEAAADYHGLPTRIEEFDLNSFLASIRPMIWQLEGPVGGLMTNALNVVMCAAREDGYTVLQNGAGPDETMGGYRNLHNLYVGQLLQNQDSQADRAVAEYAANWGVDEATARRAAQHEIEHPGTAIDGTVPWRPELLSEACRNHPQAPAYGLRFTGDPLRDALIDYTQRVKLPRGLRFLDRISMGYGLEARLPFLDKNLVEYALSLPISHYFQGGCSKSVMRRAMQDTMDDDVRISAKRSIQAPQGVWLQTEPMRSYIHDLIRSESFGDRDLFDIDKVHTSFDRFCEGADSNSFFVWQWINAEEWFRVFVDGSALTETYPVCPSIQLTARETEIVSGDTLVVAHG